MNEVLKNLTERRSCRSYLPDPIPQETLDLILEAGTYAATGMGKQSPIIIAVTDKAVRDELSAMNAAVMGAERDPFYGAPVVIAVLADKNIPTYKYDGSLVIGNLMNAAHALGIGSCWVQMRMRKDEKGGDAEQNVRQIMGIEDPFRVVGVLALGVPAEEKQPYDTEGLKWEKVHR